MKNGGVIYREHSDEARDLAETVTVRLRSAGLEMRTLAAQEPVGPAEAMAEADFAAGLELLVVIGGDGTLLRAAQIVSSDHTLVLGVKLGGLGFLTEVQPEEITPVLDSILAGNARFQDRMMIEGRIVRPDSITSFRALNEVAITCAGLPRIIDLHAWVDGVFVTSFRADGLLVSTPTGSTAYNLAAGGPIVHPGLRCLTITPVCPHTLTSRPLVIPESSTIAVNLADHDKSVTVSPDAQQTFPLGPGEKVELRAAPRGIKLVCSPSKNYYEILNAKLRWGQR